ncbi:MAG: PspA/IM30 family protein, partial [Shimia sp.]|nr:PspA/IM30 family protein [Shimia sp.]
MFGTLKTLIAGSNARAEENLRDHFAIELIDQKIREAGENLKAAKMG